ncbi:hypothetical protein D918_02737 [Trichuris suis]|nr:hypothetical protein D918_02737 [Trichuris suis]
MAVVKHDKRMALICYVYRLPVPTLKVHFVCIALQFNESASRVSTDCGIASILFRTNKKNLKLNESTARIHSAFGM